MNTRLSQFIDYATGGSQKEFAQSLGWTPQYLNNLLKGVSLGITPIVTILTKYPELNARWLLIGEGAMLTACSNALKLQLIHLLNIERYLPVMTFEEQERVINGDCDFDAESIAKWQALLAEHKAAIDARFKAAYERQKARKSR